MKKIKVLVSLSIFAAGVLIMSSNAPTQEAGPSNPVGTNSIAEPQRGPSNPVGTD